MMQSNQPQKKTPLGLLGAVLLTAGSALLVVSAFLFPPLWIAAAAIAGTGLLFCAVYGAYQLKVRYKATPPVSASIASLQPEITESVDVEAAPVAIVSPQRINPFMLAERHGSGAQLSVRALLNLPENTPLTVCINACRKQLLLWHPDQNADLRRFTSDEERTRLCSTMEFWLNVRNALAESNGETCYIRLPNTNRMTQPDSSSDPVAAHWTNIINRCDDILAGYKRMDVAIQSIRRTYAEFDKLSEQFDRKAEQFDRKAEQFDRKAEQFDRKAEQFDRKAEQFDRKAEQFDRKVEQFDRKVEQFDRKAAQFDRVCQQVRQQHHRIHQLDQQIWGIITPLIAVLKRLAQYREKIRKHTQAQQKQLRTMNRFSFFGDCHPKCVNSHNRVS